MSETMRGSRLIFMVEEWEWADTLVYSRSKPPEPTIRVGDLIEAQLWVKADSIGISIQTRQGIQFASTSEPDVVVDSIVERVGEERVALEGGDYVYALVRPGFPLVLISKSSGVSSSRGLIGKMVEARGTLYGSVSIWTGPIFSPVVVRVLSISPLPDESRLIEGITSKGETVTRVRYA